MLTHITDFLKRLVRQQIELVYALDQYVRMLTTLPTMTTLLQRHATATQPLNWTLLSALRSVVSTATTSPRSVVLGSVTEVPLVQDLTSVSAANANYLTSTRPFAPRGALSYSTTLPFVTDHASLTLKSFSELTSALRYARSSNPVFRYDYKLGNYFTKEDLVTKPFLFTTISEVTGGIRKSA